MYDRKNCSKNVKIFISRKSQNIEKPTVFKIGFLQRSCGISEKFLTWNNIFHCNRGSGAEQSRSGNEKTDLGRCPSEVRRSKRTSVRKRPQDHTYESRLCGIRRRAAKYTLWSLLIRPPFRSELTLLMFYYSLSYQYRICKNFFGTFGILSKNVVKARSAEASIGGVVWRRRIRTARRRRRYRAATRQADGGETDIFRKALIARAKRLTAARAVCIMING